MEANMQLVTEAHDVLVGTLISEENKEILDDDSVAIIGSRQCTENGKRLAYNTAKELGNKNINTISGLAIRY